MAQALETAEVMTPNVTIELSSVPQESSQEEIDEQEPPSFPSNVTAVSQGKKMLKPGKVIVVELICFKIVGILWLECLPLLGL